MPRPITWLPRLHEIRRAVANSVRSHYDRRDLERLFEVQPRSAQKLIELFPALTVGTSRLVEREALVRFLAGAQIADDIPGYIEGLRLAKAAPSRRRLRSFVSTDLPPVSFASLPESVTLSRGRLEISFGTVDQLAEDMFTLVRILDAETEEFARAYEPEPPLPEDLDQAAEEVRAMFRELEEMERARAKPSTA